MSECRWLENVDDATADYLCTTHGCFAPAVPFGDEPCRVAKLAAEVERLTGTVQGLTIGADALSAEVERLTAELAERDSRIVAALAHTDIYATGEYGIEASVLAKRIRAALRGDHA